MGGIPASIDNLTSLYEQGVRAIVTLTEHPLTALKAFEGDVIAAQGFDMLHVPIVDQDPPTREQVQEVLDFLKRMKGEGKPVYLHCHAGIGRTGTMLHAVYLLSGMDLTSTQQKIKAARPANQFFMLTTTQKTFLEALAVELAR